MIGRNAVGRRIIEARVAAGMTQTELGELSGVGQPRLSVYESGKKEPAPETLARILRFARRRPSVVLAEQAERIRAAGERQGLRDLRVFGRVVAGTDTQESVIGLLATPDPGTTEAKLILFIDEAERLLGYRVNLRTDAEGLGATLPL